MSQPLALFFWLAVLAAFLVNAWFLGADLLEWARSGETKGKLAAAALLAAAFVCGQFFFSGVSPRGGYDNEHDFQYLAADFFKPAPAGSAFYGKEVSPLVLDGIGDAVSGYSLAAVPVKNRLLLFFSAVLLFACLRRCGLGLSAAFFGFTVFYFNFLAALNGNTFSTTPGNLFYLCSALYAAAALDGGRRGYAGLVWALSGLFLVVAGRYELAVLPGLWLAVSLIRPDGAPRKLLSSPGVLRWKTWAAVGCTAALCGAWLHFIVGQAPYNGPSASEFLRPAAHFTYQLWERNLAVFSPAPAALAWLSAAAGFALIFARALAAGDRRRLVYAGLVLAWAVYVSEIFIPQDRFPLHFMRHQLYFFLPFSFLAAFAWEAAWAGRAARLKWALLIIFCAVYLRANAAAALSLEGELRSNDLEWGVLLKASRAWPRGCALAYGPYDHRRGVLRKYFPLLRGDCSRAAPACVYKYVPVHCQVFGGPEDGRPEGCTAAWLPPAAPGKSLAEVSFNHRFYTIFRGSETHLPVPVRAGFYPASGPEDRAFLLNEEGLCLLKSGSPSAAADKFGAALAQDRSCAFCELNRAAALALGGAPGAFPALKKILDSGPAGSRLPLLSAVYDAAAGDYPAALVKLKKIPASGADGRYRASVDACRIAIELRGRGPEKAR